MLFDDIFMVPLSEQMGLLCPQRPAVPQQACPALGCLLGAVSLLHPAWRWEDLCPTSVPTSLQLKTPVMGTK